MNRVVVAAMVAALPAASALAAEETQANKVLRLKHAPLANAACVVARPSGGVPVYVNGKYTIPPGRVEFTGDANEEVVRFAAEEVSFLRDRDGSSYAFGVRGPRGPVQFRPIQGSTSLQSITLPTKGGSFTLAIPHSFSGTTAGEAKSELWYRSGGVQTGKIDGVDACFYDSNSDAVYRVQDDAMRIGAGCGIPVFAPIARHFATQRGVYRIESLSPSGDSLEYSRYEGPAGKLSVASKSGEIHLVLQSQDMSLALPCNGSAWPVIPGKYTLQYGVVCVNGEIAAAIRPGSLKAFEVEADKPLAGQIGQPELDFVVRVQGSKMTIDPAQFKFTGIADEEYLKVRWVEPPEITAIRGGKSKRVGKMAFG